jgi:TM2 domain-containing membrane protein YozV
MYYLLINGQKTGPYEARDIDRMLQQSAIGYETLFWKNGMLSWEPIGSQRHLFQTLHQSPPQPQIFQQPTYQQPVQIYQQQPLIVQPVFIGVQKSRAAYIILGLFLGGLGIHNFYAGYGGKGATQLLLNLFLFWTIIVPFVIGIWVIIEVITVNHDAHGNRMV